MCVCRYRYILKHTSFPVNKPIYMVNDFFLWN